MGIETFFILEIIIGMIKISAIRTAQRNNKINIVVLAQLSMTVIMFSYKNSNC